MKNVNIEINNRIVTISFEADSNYFNYFLTLAKGQKVLGRIKEFSLTSVTYVLCSSQDAKHISKFIDSNMYYFNGKEVTFYFVDNVGANFDFYVNQLNKLIDYLESIEIDQKEEGG